MLSFPGITINDCLKDAIERLFDDSMNDKPSNVNSIILEDERNINYINGKILEIGSDNQRYSYTADDIVSMLIDYSSEIERLESLVDEKNQKIKEFENKPLDIEKAFEYVLDCNRARTL